MTGTGRRPRVVMAVGAYYPEAAGGSLQCRTLVNALADRVDFSIFTTTADRTLPATSQVDGTTVRRMFVDVRRPLTKLPAAWTMARAVPMLAATHDVFHFHGFTEKMLPLVAAARLARRATVEKMTSLGWDDPVSIRTRPRGRWLAAGMSAVDRFVAINGAMRDRCEAAGIPSRKVKLIPNGVDTVRFAPVDEAARTQLRARLGLPPLAAIVAFVGFWSREKGPHLLFDAWRTAAARTTRPSALLYIGSTNPMHAEVDASLVERVRSQVRADHLEDVVRFVEHTNDVASYLQAADAFVLPSSREGMSNALLEAMSAGLPSIAAAIPGVSDAVVESGVNGWLVPVGDTRELAERLIEIIDRPECRARVGRAARNSMLQRFSIHAVAESYFDLYRELLAASRC